MDKQWTSIVFCYMYYFKVNQASKAQLQPEQFRKSESKTSSTGALAKMFRSGYIEVKEGVLLMESLRSLSTGISFKRVSSGSLGTIKLMINRSLKRQKLLSFAILCFSVSILLATLFIMICLLLTLISRFMFLYLNKKYNQV